MIENGIFANRGGWQRRMATFACDNHSVSAIPNQPCNTEARPRPENDHRSTRYRTPTTEGMHVLLHQIRQRQCGCLEVVDDSNRLEFVPVPDLATIYRPRAVGKTAALIFYHSRDRQQRIHHWPLAKLHSQKILDGVGKFWIARYLDPLDRPKHSLSQQGKSGVCRPDIA